MGLKKLEAMVVSSGHLDTTNSQKRGEGGWGGGGGKEWLSWFFKK